MSQKNYFEKIYSTGAHFPDFFLKEKVCLEDILKYYYEQFFIVTTKGNGEKYY
jgi:hypothetical protein